MARDFKVLAVERYFSVRLAYFSEGLTFALYAKVPFVWFTARCLFKSSERAPRLPALFYLINKTYFPLPFGHMRRTRGAEGKDKGRQDSPQYYKCIHTYYAYAPCCFNMHMQEHWLAGKNGKVRELESMDVGSYDAGFGQLCQWLVTRRGKNCFRRALMSLPLI